ncbi:MAG TPA: hypothetical protein VG820_13055 [Fimbriimonadaceae bacterium]|nr:hypothetical protein [Fimbriimonadaceae bacterium]
MEKVRERLLRAVAALEGAGVRYAIAGGNAVAAWVTTIDESAVRNTRDVDVLLRREDFDKARAALEGAGFFYRHTAALEVFLDGPDAKARDAVHVIFANEKVRDHEPMANPDVTDSETAGGFQVISLDALVRIKLTAFRDKDRTHLRDMLEVGLIDASWIEKLPPELGTRLRELIDDPNG